MLALSIRQPYAELILRGIKKVEFRSRATRIIGERFFIYASKAPVAHGQGRTKSGKQIWSADLAAPAEPVPQWMLELAEQIRMIEPGTLLPTGVIVGSAVVDRVSRGQDIYEWHLADVERADRLLKPSRQPQPVWFRPF